MLKINGKYYTKNNTGEVTVFEYESMLAQSDLIVVKNLLETIDFKDSVAKPINIRKQPYRKIIDAQGLIEQSPQFIQVIIEIFFGVDCRDEPIIEWYATADSILKQLKEIVDLEHKKLKPPPTRIELEKAGIDKLNVYGVYNRVRSLMESMNMTYEQVLNTPYEEIFVHLSYNNDRAWIEHRLSEQTKIK